MPTDTKTLSYRRDFPLPPARMWPLLTDPNLRAEWGAPEDGKTLTTLSEDFREGGANRERCGPADAAEFEVETRWYHIAEAETLVYTEVIEAGGMRLGASLVTCRIGTSGAGSTVDFTIALSSFVGPEMMDEFQSGWEAGITKLQAMAAA